MIFIFLLFLACIPYSNKEESVKKAVSDILQKNYHFSGTLYMENQEVMDKSLTELEFGIEGTVNHKQMQSRTSFYMDYGMEGCRMALGTLYTNKDVIILETPYHKLLYFVCPSYNQDNIYKSVLDTLESRLIRQEKPSAVPIKVRNNSEILVRTNKYSIEDEGKILKEWINSIVPVHKSLWILPLETLTQFYITAVGDAAQVDFIVNHKTFSLRSNFSIDYLSDTLPSITIPSLENAINVSSMKENELFKVLLQSFNFAD